MTLLRCAHGLIGECAAADGALGEILAQYFGPVHIHDHTIIAVDAMRKGLGKLLINEVTIARDLDAQWPVVAEGIQTILRRSGYPQPYERLKELTRGKERITQADIATFIDGLEVDAAMKARLKELTPSNYTGIDLLQRVMP